MDRISIRDLRLTTSIGVTEEERAAPQWVRVTVELHTELKAAGLSDDLAHTIDYHRTTTEIAALVESSSCALLEHLAEKIATRMSTIDGVHGVTVEIAKESPPVEEDVGAITVRIERP